MRNLYAVLLLFAIAAALLLPACKKESRQLAVDGMLEDVPDTKADLYSVRTLAGGNMVGDRDGLGQQALFETIGQIEVAPCGTLYVIDGSYAFDPAVKTVTPVGKVTSLLKLGVNDQTSTVALALEIPKGDDLFIGRGNDFVQRRDKNGKLSVFAGDDTNVLRAPTFGWIYDMTSDGSRYMYVAGDQAYVYRVDLKTKEVTTVTQLAGPEIRSTEITGMTYASDGYLYAVLDGDCICRIDPSTGEYDVIRKWIPGDDIRDIAVARDGTVYIALRQVIIKSKDGVEKVIAGRRSTPADLWIDGPGDKATFPYINTIALGRQDSVLYVGGGHKLREVQVK